MTSRRPSPALLILLLSAFASVLSFSTVQKNLGAVPLTAIFAAYVFVTLSTWFIWFVAIYPYFFSPLRHLPRPKGERFLIGQGFAALKRPGGSFFLQAMVDVPNDGLITYRDFFNRDRLILTNAKAIADVLVHQSYNFEKPKELRGFLEQFLGNGLIIVEGDEHRFQRKHMMPSFKVGHIKELYPVFWSKALRMTERVNADIVEAPANWSGPTIEGEKANSGPCGKVEINQWANKTTLDIIGRAGLGRDFQTLEGARSELVETYEEVLDPSPEKLAYFGMNMLFPQWLINALPLELNKRTRNTTSTLRRVCGELVREGRELCKTQSDQQIDILSLLIKSNDFSDTQLSDQLLTFLAAGHETTSSAFSWTCYLLAKHWSIQSRLREEVLSAFPDISKDTPIDSIASTLESMNYLNAVCNEVLRFYPTVPITTRISTADTTIANVPVPSGTRLMISPWATNRNPHIWGEDAGRFNPERWLDPQTGKWNNEGGVSSNYVNLTFLHGPRSCIGQNFAKNELRALVAVFVSKFEFVMQRPDEEPEPAGVITTKPKGGVNMILRKIGDW